MARQATQKEALAELKRELSTRLRVYPRWVSEGKMRQEDADARTAALTQALDDLMAHYNGVQGGLEL